MENSLCVIPFSQEQSVARAHHYFAGKNMTRKLQKPNALNNVNYPLRAIMNTITTYYNKHYDKL